MPRMRARRNLPLALQNESRMPAMPRRLLEGSRRVARRDVPRLRSRLQRIPALLAVPRVRNPRARHRADSHSLHRRRGQRPAMLSAYAQRMDRAGLSLRRHRTPPTARNPRPQKSLLKSAHLFEGLVFPADREQKTVRGLLRLNGHWVPGVTPAAPRVAVWIMTEQALKLRRLEPLSQLFLQMR